MGDLGITTITRALHLPVTDVTVLAPLNDGDEVNVRITMTPMTEEARQRSLGTTGLTEGT